jgi:carbamate kinase
MGPKIEAAVHFLKGGGRRVIIAKLDEAVSALEGKTGTCVTADVT